MSVDLISRPGDMEERRRWARELSPIALMSMVVDYQAGSDDPADVDAWYEYHRRVMAGTIKFRTGSKYRPHCEKHRKRKASNGKGCPDCKKIIELYEAAGIEFPSSSKRAKRIEPNDRAGMGATGD